MAWLGRWSRWVLTAGACWAGSPLLAAEMAQAGVATPETGRVAADASPATALPEVVVRGESEMAETVQAPFLPEIQGTRIHAGKKTSVMDLDALPKVNNNNYRQALTKTPGLLLSEETTPLVSVGYRGLNPHRAQFMQVLQDGLPIHADPFGYPEAYYTPPLDTVDRMEFVHGGASLMFGPQPGGSLNYVTHRPRTDVPFSARSQHVFGSDQLYSTFNSIDGTLDRVGYYAYFNHRQTDGFRAANSDFDLFTGSAKLVLDATRDSRWILNYDGYAEEHGEPGGLTFETGPGAVNYRENREAASRLWDRFRLDRHFASLGWEKDFSDRTALTVSGWGGYYSRFSKRQRGGGFGLLPSGPAAESNTIEHQEFYTQGIEGRLRHHWMLGAHEQTLSVGAQLFHTDSPRTDRRGATADAEDGVVRNQSERDTFYAPVFVENRFVLGSFSVTPGVRIENLRQSVREEINVEKTGAGTPLGDDSEFDTIPLLGVGLEYALHERASVYGNVSQAYRPKVFTEAVPTGGITFVNQDLEESKSWQYEVGFRGRALPFLTWDTSLFWLDFDNQIGNIAVPGGTSLENVGRAVHRGWEAAMELELLGALARARGEENASGHQLSLYGNVMLLDAEFASGPREGNTPQYAPELLTRVGTIYRWRDRGKIALMGTFVSDHFADDSNTASFTVPGYSVWDLTLEWKVYRQTLSVVAGLNNLLDQDYYSRIRGDGIDPAYGRNYYAGLSVAF